MVDIECGEDGCRTEGIENRQCLPIAVPMGDPDFPDKKCLMFVRSQEAPPGDCHCSTCTLTYFIHIVRITINGNV